MCLSYVLLKSLVKTAGFAWCIDATEGGTIPLFHCSPISLILGLLSSVRAMRACSCYPIILFQTLHPGGYNQILVILGARFCSAGHCLPSARGPCSAVRTSAERWSSGRGADLALDESAG